MRCDLNNWLLKEADDMQYWLAGFALGFAEAALNLRKDKANGDSIRKMVVNIQDAKIIQSVDWLHRLQSSGIDTGSPSTENLFHSLQEVFNQLEIEGPIRHEYGNQRQEARIHAPDSREHRIETLHSARRVGMGIEISWF